MIIIINDNNSIDFMFLGRWIFIPRSKHTHILDPKLTQACRGIIGCLKSNNVGNLLSGIAPADIRRVVCARIERAKQVNSHKVIWCNEWQKKLRNRHHTCAINLTENFVKWYGSPWTMWRFLNIIRTGYTCSKEQREIWE